jgi:hypothetical protein
MQVVRHEAVSNNCNAFVSRGLQQLRKNDVNGFARDEDTHPPLRANGQEISVTATVIEPY